MRHGSGHPRDDAGPRTSIALRPNVIAAVLVTAAIAFAAFGAGPTPPTLELVAEDLANPRGVAVLPSGGLILAEAGSGRHEGPGRFSGRLLHLVDRNGDGRWIEPDERRTILAGQISYNGRSVYGTGRDEVGGLSDVALGPDGLLLFTKDDPFEGYLADGARQDIAVAGIPLSGGEAFVVARRSGTLNALAWDPGRREVFVVESGANRLTAVTLHGHSRVVTAFEPLAHGQQAVPAGMARDPRTGDLLVALFSGVLYDAPSPGDRQSFVPGDAKVVRVDPDTGDVRDEITGLTTAIDVAVGPNGTIYVLEHTTGAPSPRLPEAYDLHDRSAPPHAGGYARFAGRLTAFAPTGRSSLIAGHLDAPTHLTLAEGSLYVSTGQGTPGRAIPRGGSTDRIEGRLWRIRLPPESTAGLGDRRCSGC